MIACRAEPIPTDILGAGPRPHSLAPGCISVFDDPDGRSHALIPGERCGRIRALHGPMEPSPALSMSSRAAPTAETGPAHQPTIQYNIAEQSRVQTLQRIGDSRPALHAGSRSRMRPTLVA